ncbi:unnamed protein product [Discula destructiva]
MASMTVGDTHISRGNARGHSTPSHSGPNCNEFGCRQPNKVLPTPKGISFVKVESRKLRVVSQGGGKSTSTSLSALPQIIAEELASAELMSDQSEINECTKVDSASGMRNANNRPTAPKRQVHKLSSQPSSPMSPLDLNFDLDRVPDSQPGRTLPTPQWSPFTEPPSPSPASLPLSLIMQPWDGGLARLQKRLQEDLAEMPARRLTPKKLRSAADLVQMACVGDAAMESLELWQLEIEEELTRFEMHCQDTPARTWRRTISISRPAKRRLGADEASSRSRSEKKARTSHCHLNRETSD